MLSSSVPVQALRPCCSEVLCQDGLFCAAHYKMYILSPRSAQFEQLVCLMVAPYTTVGMNALRGHWCANVEEGQLLSDVA